MSKQNNNAGLGTAGPHRQGEKGGKGGIYKGGAGSGGKKSASQSNPSSGANAGQGRTAKVGIQNTEGGRESGNQ